MHKDYVKIFAAILLAFLVGAACVQQSISKDVKLTDLITSIATVGAVVIAWMGINTWKLQIQVQYQYKLLHEINKAIFDIKMHTRNIDGYVINVLAGLNDKGDMLENLKSEVIDFELKYTDLCSHVDNCRALGLLDSSAVLPSIVMYYMCLDFFINNGAFEYAFTYDNYNESKVDIVNNLEIFKNKTRVRMI